MNIKKKPLISEKLFCVPKRIRTSGLWNRNPTLYPTELWVPINTSFELFYQTTAAVFVFPLKKKQIHLKATANKKYVPKQKKTTQQNLKNWGLNGWQTIQTLLRQDKIMTPQIPV